MARDLKEAIENFKAVARPFQAMVEIVEQLDASATDLRTVKELEGRAKVMQRGQEEALKEIADEKKIAKDFAKAKIQDANVKADKIIEEARKTAEAVLNSAQVKASAVDNELKEKQDKAEGRVKELEVRERELQDSLAKLGQDTAVAEKKLQDAQAKIQKMLEG